jgi:hypothetical protein
MAADEGGGLGLGNLTGIPVGGSGRKVKKVVLINIKGS